MKLPARYAALVVALAAACSKGNEAPGYHVEPRDPQELTGDGPHSHGLRKLTVDELQAAVSVAAGKDALGQPIDWRVDVNGNGMPLDAFSDEAFGKILGRPDYVAVTEESGEPTMLYVKLVGDMARSVCGRIVLSDVQRTAGQTLWRYAPHTSEPTQGQLDANLEYLVLRFLGVRARAGEPLLESFRAVYHASAAAFQGGTSTPQVEGWRGVCIALFEDPLFHIH